MNIEPIITASRPSTATANETFTDKVMQKITKKQPRKPPLGLFLRHSPALAVLTAVLVLAIISGGVYAAMNYILPQINITSYEPGVSPTGRKAVTIMSQACNQDIANTRYELKAKAPLSANDIPKVVQAMCEEHAATQWIHDTYPETANPPNGSGHPMTPNTTFVRESAAAVPPQVVTEISSTAIAINAISYEGVPSKITVANPPRVIIDGIEGDYTDIKVGDPVIVAYKARATITTAADCTPEQCGDANIQTDNYELLAVVKLPQAPEWYSKAGQIAKVTMCTGNPEDVCHFNHAIDLYPTRGEEMPPAYDQTPQAKHTPHEIAGTITQIEPCKITLKSSSGRTFTVETASDIVQTYNTSREADYGTGAVGIGDTIQIMYSGDDSRDIALRQVLAIQLILEETTKVGTSGRLNKY